MKKLFVQFVCALPTLEAFGWSLLSGVVGTSILAGFLSTITSLALLSNLLPPIAGFNAAISGYMLIDRNGDELSHLKILSATVGATVALVSVTCINWFCFSIGSFFLLSDLQGVISVVMGVIGGWAGGMLAIKYKQIKNEANNPASESAMVPPPGRKI